MYGIIYLLTNAATSAKYVGQTIQGLDARFSQHVSDAKAGESTPIASAIREYGQQAFIKKVLETGVPSSKLDDRETHYISLYNTRQPYGYNERMP